MDVKIFVFFIVAFVSVQSKALDTLQSEIAVNENPVHKMIKRFINPSLTNGGFSGENIQKLRAKRSYEEECEKLNLCKLHARANSNFFAAFELYFVNKENARLWDHQARSIEDCNERYSCDR
ncbi:unnamed protein product [Euphydryas editha]|uniref:Uncharacterized protein n=1 Tax=Euphydryas editha TaxID=104508 RepID=A0AAU9UYQ6_EUPED|nr:unnamed protein product [Euphydryas editha]